MAIKHFCDRCSKQLEANEDGQTPTVIFVYPTGKKVEGPLRGLMGTPLQVDEQKVSKKTVCQMCFVVIYRLFPPDEADKPREKEVEQA